MSVWRGTAFNALIYYTRIEATSAVTTAQQFCMCIQIGLTPLATRVQATVAGCIFRVVCSVCVLHFKVAPKKKKETTRSNGTEGGGRHREGGILRGQLRPTTM